MPKLIYGNVFLMQNGTIVCHVCFQGEPGAAGAAGAPGHQGSNGMPGERGTPGGPGTKGDKVNPKNSHNSSVNMLDYVHSEQYFFYNASCIKYAVWNIDHLISSIKVCVCYIWSPLSKLVKIINIISCCLFPPFPSPLGRGWTQRT